MDTLFIVPLIEILQSFPAEIVSIFLFAVCTVAILVLFRFFGAPGLYLFNIVAVLAANIQVLRGVQFSLSPEPVALGTVVFATTYLCSDLLTEHYGKEAAKLGVWYCFAAQLLMTLLMVISVGYPNLPAELSNTSALQHLQQAEKALALLFTPSPRLLIASLLAFAVSQFNDIWIFQALNIATKGRLLWLRTSVSSIVSAFVDTVLFSVLAWVILAPQPVGLSTLIFTYILGTFVTRAFMSLFATPVMYLSYHCKPSSLSLNKSLTHV